MTAWMGTLNSLRLVLGTRLDVDEELPTLDPDDPLAPAAGLRVPGVAAVAGGRRPEHRPAPAHHRDPGRP